ncbi:MAG: chloride channel protein [Pseudomonadota bacterium]
MFKQLLEYRRSLTRYESALAYAILGIGAGFLSGAAVIIFEHAIDKVALLWGVDNRADNFEALPPLYRSLLPIGGALVLGLFFTFLREEDRDSGIAHVISRMYGSYGALPLRNALAQFIGGVTALSTGQSGGREGPGVHLGSAVASLAGQRLGLPNNSLRVLIACGSAGSIAAAFNTPLAGVIFTMEVIVSEYSVAGFVPVMLSAVTASALSKQFGGGVEIFEVGEFQLASLAELPLVLCLGLACGVYGAIFVKISSRASTFNERPVLLRFLLAGTVSGCMAFWVPETLGLGYDTLESALFGQLAWTALILIATVKVVTAALSLGLGMPVGVIGPSLMIGACVGGAAGSIAELALPTLAIDAGMYVTIGMGAMMATTLGAPLAASLAVIELTQSTSVAMPALLAIIAAHLMNLTVFKQLSAHRMVLKQRKLRVPDDPLNQLLHRTDISSAFDGSVVVIGERMTAAIGSGLAVQVPNWCLIRRENEDLFLVNGPELIDLLEARKGDPEASSESPDFDITESSLRRWSIAHAPEQATLSQALDVLRVKTAEGICVYRKEGGKRVLRGVLTRDMIDRFTLRRIDGL